MAYVGWSTVLEEAMMVFRKFFWLRFEWPFLWCLGLVVKGEAPPATGCLCCYAVAYVFAPSMF